MSDYLDEFDLTVSTLWREERLSCPHRDVMLAFVDGELPPAQLDYLRFHLEQVGCASCRAMVSELGASPTFSLAAGRVPGAEDSDAERAVRERLLRSTSSYLSESRKGRRRDS